MKNKKEITNLKFLYIFKDNISQIFAITEKNLKGALRFKVNLMFSYFYPIIGLIIPMIILNKFFSFNINFSPWTESNYVIFILLAYNISLLSRLYNSFSAEFKTEKYWRTLQALIIAPFNRINLLLGIFLTNIISVMIPFSILIVICYIYYPINIITFLFVMFLFVLVAFIFSGIGLFLGVIAISKENYLSILNFAMNLILWASCLSFPFQIYPELFQSIINLNPFYYIFDLLRLSWIHNDVFFTLSLYWSNFVVSIIGAIIVPVFGVILFNLIYKKYGIVGY